MAEKRDCLKIIDWVIGILLIVFTYLLGFTVEQNDFWKIIAFYSTFFFIYLMVIWKLQPFNRSTLYFFIGLSILLRLILVFSMPNLSNDVYRFIWDGRLMVQGYNPFDHLPLYYLENETGLKGITPQLYESFGSKNFYTVYPPVAQAQFGSACWFFPQDAYWSSVFMKIWLFIFEIGTILLIIKLLNKFRLPDKNVLLYALNPLILFEIMGNLHFEGAMIFFLLLAVWLFTVEKFNWSAVAFALSICSKLLTILFLPFFIKRIGWKSNIQYFLVVGISCVLLFLPIINTSFIYNFSDSLGLYFQKLEFNASFYYFFRWVLFQITGYNQIAVLGPALGMVAAVLILYVAFVKQICKGERANVNWLHLIRYWLFAICIYLFCTTTMHPWYTALPIVLCIFTNYRFPIVWSYLIFWTYINYKDEVYQEHLWVVIIEYLILFAWLVWEYRSNHKKVLSLR